MSSLHTLLRISTARYQHCLNTSRNLAAYVSTRCLTFLQCADTTAPQRHLNIHKNHTLRWMQRCITKKSRKSILKIFEGKSSAKTSMEKLRFLPNVRSFRGGGDIKELHSLVETNISFNNCTNLLSSIDHLIIYAKESSLTSDINSTKNYLQAFVGKNYHKCCISHP